MPAILFFVSLGKYLIAFHLLKVVGEGGVISNMGGGSDHYLLVTFSFIIPYNNHLVLLF